MAEQASRVALWGKLQRSLSALSDAELMALRDSAPPQSGWGANRILEVDGTRVFAKSLLVTEAELSDPFGTQNVHSLPPYYSYGLGSAGFRAGREVALHSETTRWVLDGACTHFPLTYHHRLLPAGHRTPKVTPDALDAYVQSWNHHPAIRPLVEARNAATMEVFIVLEYIPFVLREWFFDQADAAPRFMTQLDAATHFLAEKGVVHFDAHGGNIVTDGVDFYLTDFGLGMADSFELNRQERAFLHRHRHYDRGLATCGLLFPLAGAVRRLTDPARKQLEARFGDTGTVTIASNIRQLVDEGLLDLPHSMVDLLEPRIEVIHRVVSFFDALRESVHTARFPDADMQRHLPSLPSARV